MYAFEFKLQEGVVEALAIGYAGLCKAAVGYEWGLRSEVFQVAISASLHLHRIQIAV